MGGLVCRTSVWACSRWPVALTASWNTRSISRLCPGAGVKRFYSFRGEGEEAPLHGSGEDPTCADPWASRLAVRGRVAAETVTSK
jgi:hypothetical protein